MTISSSLPLENIFTEAKRMFHYEISRNVDTVLNIDIVQ